MGFPSCRRATLVSCAIHTRVRHLPTPWPAISSLRSTTCRSRHKRPSNRSIGIFRENRLDRTTPRALKFLQKFFGRGVATGGDLAEDFEMARLITPFAVVACAPLQSGVRQLKTFSGQIEHRSTPDRRLQCLPGHIIA